MFSEGTLSPVKVNLHRPCDSTVFTVYSQETGRRLSSSCELLVQVQSGHRANGWLVTLFDMWNKLVYVKMVLTYNIM